MRVSARPDTSCVFTMCVPGARLASVTSLHIAMANHASNMLAVGATSSGVSDVVDQTALLAIFDNIQVKHDAFAASTRPTASTA